MIDKRLHKIWILNELRRFLNICCLLKFWRNYKLITHVKECLCYWDIFNVFDLWSCQGYLWNWIGQVNILVMCKIFLERRGGGWKKKKKNFLSTQVHFWMQHMIYMVTNESATKIWKKKKKKFHIKNIRQNLSMTGNSIRFH